MLIRHTVLGELEISLNLICIFRELCFSNLNLFDLLYLQYRLRVKLLNESIMRPRHTNSGLPCFFYKIIVEGIRHLEYFKIACTLADRPDLTPF